MTELPFHDGQESPATLNGAVGKRCRHTAGFESCTVDHQGQRCPDGVTCVSCGHRIDTAASRRGRNNDKRGKRAELAVARMIPGARKMGPLGLPWDVEVGTYARLQVKKLVSRPSLAEIARLIHAIPDTGDRLRGFVWVEAAGRGKRGEVRVWFGIVEFAKWHGLESPGITTHWGTNLISLPLAEWVAEFVEEPR